LPLFPWPPDLSEAARAVRRALVLASHVADPYRRRMNQPAIRSSTLTLLANVLNSSIDAEAGNDLTAAQARTLIAEDSVFEHVDARNATRARSASSA
jgi:hypothetical protein